MTKRKGMSNVKKTSSLNWIPIHRLLPLHATWLCRAIYVKYDDRKETTTTRSF